MQIITSKDNENIKSIKKLKERKYIDLNNKVVVYYNFVIVYSRIIYLI